MLIVSGMERETENFREGEEVWIPLPARLEKWSSHFILSERQVRIWSLVLESRKVPWRTERFGMGWLLLVPEANLDKAFKELSLFEEENRNWPPPPPPPHRLTENTLATLSVLLLLAVFHNLTLLQIPLLGQIPPDWTQIGKAQAARILDGEWWRLITSLTLHANSVHLLSNLTIGGIFIIFLCRELGSGLAWSLLLCSGMLGNLANAHFNLPTHSSVGASTLVFGCVGILASISLVRYRHHLRKRWFVPVAGAMALLASLGTEGEHTDLGAHLFGFIFGIGIGLVAEYMIERYGPPGRRLNALLALGSAMAVASAWWAAVVYGGN